MRTNTPITVYNKIFDKKNRKYFYQRTIIENAFWQEKQAYNRLVSGNSESDKVITLIPMLNSFEREYIQFKLFSQVNNQENYFTLQNEDIIVKGAIEDEVKGSDITELQDKYETFTITSVDTFDYGSKHMQHWKVGAK